MKRYYHAKDMYEYSPETVHQDLNKRELNKIIKEIKKRRKQKPIPSYFRKKIYYTYDPDNYTYTATEVQKLVSLSLQNDNQKDYSRKLVEIATANDYGENMDGYYEAQKNLEARLRLERASSKATIIETNMRFFQRSKQ